MLMLNIVFALAETSNNTVTIINVYLIYSLCNADFRFWNFSYSVGQRHQLRLQSLRCRGRIRY